MEGPAGPLPKTFWHYGDHLLVSIGTPLLFIFVPENETNEEMIVTSLRAHHMFRVVTGGPVTFTQESTVHAITRQKKNCSKLSIDTYFATLGTLNSTIINERGITNRMRSLTIWIWSRSWWLKPVLLWGFTSIYAAVYTWRPWSTFCFRNSTSVEMGRF